MEEYTLKMFMEDYDGFDWDNGTIVLIKKTGSRNYIISKDSPWRCLIDEYNDSPVWNWNHDENVMVITLLC